MIKRRELTDPNSCLNKAADDELLFVLIGRDEDMADTVRYWTRRRIRRGKNRADDAQIIEALQLADTLDRMHKPPTARRQPPELGTINVTTCVVCPSLPCPHCGRQWNPEPIKLGEVHADNPVPYCVPHIVQGDM